MAGEVDVQASRAGADGCARAHGAHVVGLGGIIILDQMIEETPLPNDRPGGVNFHQRVHLPAGGGRGGRVGTGGNQLVIGQVLVGDIKNGIGVELLVENAGEIVVRIVGRAGLGV